MESIRWKELKIGDIIYLRKGEIAPCDLILLDSNEVWNREAICYVRDEIVSGKSDIILKKACSTTQSNINFIQNIGKL